MKTVLLGPFFAHMCFTIFQKKKLKSATIKCVYFRYVQSRPIHRFMPEGLWKSHVGHVHKGEGEKRCPIVNFPHQELTSLAETLNSFSCSVHFYVKSCRTHGTTKLIRFSFGLFFFWASRLFFVPMDDRSVQENTIICRIFFLSLTQCLTMGSFMFFSRARAGGQLGVGVQDLECIFALVLSQEGPVALLTSLHSSSVV